MVLGLNMLARRFPVLDITDVDIAGAFRKYLVKRSILKPQRKMANRISCLKIESLAADDAAHGGRRDE